MSRYDIPDTMITKLADMLRRHDAVRSGYLFGSMALGIATDRSDVDIAVRVDLNLSSEAAFELRLKLMDELESVMGRPVDVVVLNSSSLKMIRQVLKSGRLVYAARPEEETAYAIQKRKEYFDFRYYLDMDRKAMKAFFNA